MRDVSGSWSLMDIQPCTLPKGVEQGFQKVTENSLGVSYTPVLYCGEQKVIGKNHMVICKQTFAAKGPVEQLVKLVFHEILPENGVPGRFDFVSIRTI